MTLNREKCKFFCNRVKFLGQIVDEAGICPDTEKIQGIVQTTISYTPGYQCHQSIPRSCLMSKFSPHLADETQPLRELLERDITWHWGDQQETSFSSIQTMLTSTPILALFDLKRETIPSRHMGLEPYCSKNRQTERGNQLPTVQGPDLGETEIFLDRKGGIGHHLGTPEPLRLLARSLFPHKN